MFIHTNLLWKKFRARLSLNWTREKGKRNQTKNPVEDEILELAESVWQQHHPLTDLEIYPIHKPLTF
jgi:hypothetical protein